jgi:cell division protein FtsQ
MVGDAFEFSSARVEIIGGARTDEEALAARIREAAEEAISTDKLAMANIHELMREFHKIGWVKNVAVRREYPHRLASYVEPRHIIASWKNGGRIVPVDYSGEALREKTDKIFPPVITGEDAPQNVPALIETLMRYPQIFQNLAAAERVSGMRWNIILYDADDGLMIMLPAAEPEKALDEIAALDRRGDILKRRISIIDARVPEKISVKPK